VSFCKFFLRLSNVSVYLILLLSVSGLAAFNSLCTFRSNKKHLLKPEHYCFVTFTSTTSRRKDFNCKLRLKCDGTRAETRFCLSAKRTSPFKSAGTSVQSTTGSRGVRISGSNAGYTMFRGSVKGTGYPLHSPVSPSLPLLWVAVCHHVSTGLYP